MVEHILRIAIIAAADSKFFPQSGPQTARAHIAVPAHTSSLFRLYQALQRQTKRCHHHFLQYVEYEVILNNEACSLESVQLEWNFITSDVLC
jgi:hypothetical protein